MVDDRFAADGYKIIQSVEIDGMEIVVAETPAAEKPYLSWRRSRTEAFGAESHLLPVYSDNYVDILREFIHSQSVCIDNISLSQVYRGSAVADAPLCAGDCVPGGLDQDLKGQVVALRADVLLPEYRACSHQLILASGGFGCSPTSRGNAVFGVNIYSGEQERWNRTDILGIVAEPTLPGWAHEKLSRLREPQEKESVLAKIRESKSNPPAPKEGPQQKKNHDPEL